MDLVDSSTVGVRPREDAKLALGRDCPIAIVYALHEFPISAADPVRDEDSAIHAAHGLRPALAAEERVR